MTKQQAIAKIKEIQSGRWDRNKPEPPKGSLAKTFWTDETFAYGMEYGAIVALMQAFEITKDDLIVDAHYWMPLPPAPNVRVKPPA